MSRSMLFLVCLLAWASSGFAQTTFAGARLVPVSAVDVGPDGSVVLVVKQNGFFYIRKCDRYTVIKQASDCNPVGGESKVTAVDFENQLRALALGLRNASNFERWTTINASVKPQIQLSTSTILSSFTVAPWI
jgi:hypothetical protein